MAATAGHAASRLPVRRAGRSPGPRSGGIRLAAWRVSAAALAAGNNPIQPHSAATGIFISPGFEFRVVGALLTNFHLPQSSLLMLVSAFAGQQRIGPHGTGLAHVLAAYRHAVQSRYRFFSYGDCMFIQ